MYKCLIGRYRRLYFCTRRYFIAADSVKRKKIVVKYKTKACYR